jgi:hypothetical protein
VGPVLGAMNVFLTSFKIRSILARLDYICLYKNAAIKYTF